MGKILSDKEIKKNFRIGLNKDISLQAINHFAKKLGYSKKRGGAKIGYDQSLYTLLTRHLKELMDYDAAMLNKSPQKPLKQPNIEDDYFMMNGERDNKDYDWEIDENVIKNRGKVMKILENYNSAKQNFGKNDAKQALEAKIPIDENMGEKLTILWLDDMRNPYKYLSDVKNKSNTFNKNKEFYDNLMSQYNIDFVWVKNINEFSNYIIKNGLPQFISFDHDLGKGLPKGLDCAKWLIDYCNKTSNKLPNFFVHSANPNGQREINAVLNNSIKETKIIKLTETDLYKIIKESVIKILKTL